MDTIGLIPSFGNLVYTVAAFVVALSIIVAVHEYGHYIVGRWSGIRAEVFSLGFGPALFGRTDRHGTRWQVAALPFGGYVKFLGDANAASAGPDASVMAHLSPAERRHTIHGAPLWARAVTVAAGPVFNFVLATLLFAAVMLGAGVATDRPTVGALYPLPGGSGGLRPGDEILAVEGRPAADFEALFALADSLPPAASYAYRIRRDGAEVEVPGPALYPPRAGAVIAGSAAFDAGLKSGDVILSADGRPMRTFAELQAAVSASEGRPVALVVWREGREPVALSLTPRRTDSPLPGGGFETEWRFGVGGQFFFDPATRTPGLAEALGQGWAQTWTVVGSSLSGLWHMVTGAISSCNLRGPLTIAETSGAAASEGAVNFFWFVAALSAAVGLMNLFPIPMLDGGHLVFHAWEWAAGRPPPDRVLRVLTTAGLAIVLALMVFGMSNDLFCP